MNFRLAILATALLLLSSCWWQQRPAPEKRFPGGDLLDHAELPQQTEDEQDSLPPVEDLAAPRVRIAGVSDDRGLILAAAVEAPRVPAGARLSIKATLNNTTATARPLRYRTEQRFDAAIFADKEQRKLVHLWSAGQAFGQAAQEVRLGPGSHLTRFLEIVTTRMAAESEMLGLDASKPLAAGTYYVWVTHEGEPFLSAGPYEIIIDP